MSIFIIIIIYFATSIAFISSRAPHPVYQSPLQPFKTTFQLEPIVFQLHKEKKSEHAQKQFITFIQKNQQKIESISLLQHDLHSTNIDQEKIPAILGLDNFHNTQVLFIIDFSTILTFFLIVYWHYRTWF